MATEMTTEGVAIQASNGGVWAVVGSTAALVFAAFLKFLTDSNTRQMAAQATAHAGEKATLLALYGRLENDMGKLQAEFTKLSGEFAALKANFDLQERANKQLVERVVRRDVRIKALADEVTILRHENAGLRVEINALCVESDKPVRYGADAVDGANGRTGGDAKIVARPSGTLGGGASGSG